jgi:hypothetical protein
MRLSLLTMAFVPAAFGAINQPCVSMAGRPKAPPQRLRA